MVGIGRRTGEVNGDRDQRTESRAAQQTPHRVPNEMKSLFGGFHDMPIFHQVVRVFTGDSIAGSTILKQWMVFYTIVCVEQLDVLPVTIFTPAFRFSIFVNIYFVLGTRTLHSFMLGRVEDAIDGVEQVGRLLAVADYFRTLLCLLATGHVSEPLGYLDLIEEGQLLPVVGLNHTPDEVLEPRSVDDLKDADACGHAIDIEEVFSHIGLRSVRYQSREVDWSKLISFTSLDDLHLLLLGRDHSLLGLR